MEKGDYVVALGDNWISPGSVGVIQSLKKGSGSVYVIWHKTTDLEKCKPGRGLYHSQNRLRVCEKGYVDPNLEFKIRRQK